MICLDFDGVLFDSANEAFYIGRETFFGGSLSFDNPNINYKRFLLLRPFVDSAWQYRIVFELLLENISNQVMISKAKFKLNGSPSKEDIKFAKKFNQIRTEMMANEKSRWIDLNKPYEFFYSIKPLFENYSNEFFICSTKSSKFIIEILSANGIKFKSTHVWGKEFYEANENSKALILRKNTKFDDTIIFVDDSPRHIEDMKSLKNVDAILAKWGYLETGKISDNHKFIINKIMELLIPNDKKN